MWNWDVGSGILCSLFLEDIHVSIILDLISQPKLSHLLKRKCKNILSSKKECKFLFVIWSKIKFLIKDMEICPHWFLCFRPLFQKNTLKLCRKFLIGWNLDLSSISEIMVDMISGNWIFPVKETEKSGKIFIWKMMEFAFIISTKKKSKPCSKKLVLWKSNPTIYANCYRIVKDNSKCIEFGCNVCFINLLFLSIWKNKWHICLVKKKMIIL